MTVHSATTHPSDVPPGSPTHRRQLAAGGCFAVLMLAALIAAWVINRPAMQPDVLRQALADATAERDELQAQLAELRASVSSVAPVPIRLYRHADTSAVAVQLETAAPLALAGASWPRTVQLVLRVMDDGTVVGWVDERNDFGADGSGRDDDADNRDTDAPSRVRRLLRRDDDGTWHQRVVTSTADTDWRAVREAVGDVTAESRLVAGWHHPVRIRLPRGPDHAALELTVGTAEPGAELPLVILPSANQARPGR